MSMVVVSGTFPVRVVRRIGSTVTFANQDAAAVLYISVDRSELAPFAPNSTAVGGFQLKAGVAFVWQNFPGEAWVRASGGGLSDGGTNNLEVTP